MKKKEPFILYTKEMRIQDELYQYEKESKQKMLSLHKLVKREAEKTEFKIPLYINIVEYESEIVTEIFDNKKEYEAYTNGTSDKIKTFGTLHTLIDYLESQRPIKEQYNRLQYILTYSQNNLSYKKIINALSYEHALFLKQQTINQHQFNTTKKITNIKLKERRWRNGFSNRLSRRTTTKRNIQTFI